MSPRTALALLLPLALAPAAPAAEEWPPIRCLVGPSMRESVEALARVFREREGVRVVVETNDPRSLIENIKVEKDVDLFVSHDPFLAMLDRDGVKVARVWVPAALTPVIAVAKGNPKEIRGLKDLAKPGIRFGATDPASAITGNILRRMLDQAGIRREVEANVTSRAPAGRVLAAELADGKLDAAFVWDAVAFANRDTMDAVAIPPDQRPKPGPASVMDHPALGKIELDYVRVTVSLLESSPNADAARAFAELLDSDEGRAVFRARGFSPPDPERGARRAEAPSR